MQQPQEKFIKVQRKSQKNEEGHSSYSPDKEGAAKRKLRKIGPYILLEQIGKGSYSKVFLARAEWGLFAVKQISLQNVKQKQLQRIHQQVEVLSLVKHPNVIEMVDFKQTPHNLYLVFQHCPHTDLAVYIEKHYQGKLPQQRVKTIVAQLRDAFRVIRRHRIVHRDLKLSNILLSEDFQIKLADFGFAKLHGEKEFLNSFVGTPLTMAPQIIQRKQYDQRCDIWSLGVITYQMLFGKNPFFTKAKLSMTQIKESFSRPLQFPGNISVLAVDFLKRMLVKDPTNRMTFEAFFEHPWLKGEEAKHDVLKIQALGRQLHRSLSSSSKSTGQKQFLLSNCQAVLGFALIQFIRGHLQNCLAGWINLAKQIIDLNHSNKALSFAALAVLLGNLDEALAQPIPILINAKHLLTFPKYSQLRKLQKWEMSQFSMRLPHLIAKGRTSIEGFLQHESTVQLEQINKDGDCLLSEVLLRQLRREVQKGDDQARVFLRVRPWQSSTLCLTIQAPSLTATATEILVANVKVEPIEYHQLCRKCSSLFRINIVNQTTPLYYNFNDQEIRWPQINPYFADFLTESFDSIGIITDYSMLALTEKELGHALFYSIKRQDFDHAEYLLSLDAPLATSYFISQDRIAYTPNLLAGKVAQTISKLGLAHARSQQVLRILDRFINGKCDWRCHCVPKNPHYCPLSEVLKWLPLDRSDDLLCEQNLLLLKLLYHGATYKNLVGSKDALWAGISQLQAYIEIKQEQVVELVKMNRHGKACTSRHAKCRNQRPPSQL